MASVTRLIAFSTVRRSLPQSLTNIGVGRSSLRRISTSPKKHETSAACNQAKTTKNWVSYGLNFHNKELDRHGVHVLFFMAVSVCLVFGGVYIGYSPDLKMNDWALREAYLELRRREENGLPLVDPNLIPLDKMVLPTEEELGDAEVII